MLAELLNDAGESLHENEMQLIVTVPYVIREDGWAIIIFFFIHSAE